MGIMGKWENSADFAAARQSSLSRSASPLQGWVAVTRSISTLIFSWDTSEERIGKGGGVSGEGDWGDDGGVSAR